MIVHVLACDYDGTIADRGRLAPDTAAALRRVRESGRKVMLVTGRMLPDLRHVCPEVDALFDAVVAENGAVLYVPDRREVKILGDAPEPRLVEALQRRQVPFDLGSAIVATTGPFADAALDAIRETGVERTLVFNKGALMLLPGGVTKGTGLDAALARMELSAHNVVAVGDAENDHAFLNLCEFAVAVADAVPALAERADFVTPGPASRGVIELIDEHVLRDAVDLAGRARRHRLAIGETSDGHTVLLSPHATRLFVVGPSASGKSTLTGVLVERLVEQGRAVCLLDPEGDYQSLTDLEGVVVLGGKADRALPTREELAQLLRRPRSSLVLNLSAMSRAEKVQYGTQALASVAAVRGSHGLPHWLIVDEAHHVFPKDGSPATELILRGRDSVCLITLDVEALAAELRAAPNVVASTDLDAFNTTLTAIAEARGDGSARLPAALGGAALDAGEAAVAWLDGEPGAQRFRVARRRVEHRRHVRKYVEGELPPHRSFYFRGANGALNLRAANLERFCKLAEGVDEQTWLWHFQRGDYSRWLREMIKDAELADEVAALEARPGTASDSRRATLAAIRRRYAA
ncbi:MAG: HAD-IIB family hydrolase [Candidatus Rokubacteria bacterium]|nr:HAD-IIB family hydrolase [Candidatus Rokubacteria bacterium]